MPWQLEGNNFQAVVSINSLNAQAKYRDEKNFQKCPRNHQKLSQTDKIQEKNRFILLPEPVDFFCTSYCARFFW